MIKFIIRAKKNPLKRDQVKFYPQMAPGAPVMLRTIVGRIEKRSGVSLSLIHISEPTRRVVISYAVFCLKKKYLFI